MHLDGSTQDDISIAKLSWAAGDMPSSLQFGDVYYSRDHGLSESEHVFIRPNRLAERWQALPDRPDTQFRVGETGFGTGLNFLLSWRAWRLHAPASARLLYTSIERYPLASGDLDRALSAWPELKPFAEALVATLPPLLPGFHLLPFDGGRVVLRLCLGDATRMLDALRARLLPSAAPGDAMDAWYLDGFSPARNPEMWTSEVFQGVAALSRPGTTCSSFTVAGAVRRGLQAVGFRMTKAPGFGSKRECLQGEFTATIGAELLAETPWDCPVAVAGRERTAVVVGAGIAGCTTALALAARGWQVQLLERAATVAAGASGNPQGILYTRLPIDDSDYGAFNLSAWLYALRYYGALGDQYSGIHLDGLLLLDEPATDSKRRDLSRRRYAGMQRWFEAVDQDRAGLLAGVAVDATGMWLPLAGWLQPALVCARLVDHSGITVHYGADVTSLSQRAEYWQVDADDGRQWQTGTVVLANATDVARLIDTNHLGLGVMRGQISQLPVAAGAATPRCVICGDGYVAPALGGLLSIGASYRKGDNTAACSADEHRENLARLARLAPELEALNINPESLQGRVALRCTSRDYLPVVGPAPELAALQRVFAPLRRDAREVLAQTCPVWPGLYLNLAHGSRGLANAPLCAELLAASICDEPLPLPRRLARQLHPARFAVRQVIRGQI